jgi:hypothetical protein
MSNGKEFQMRHAQFLVPLLTATLFAAGAVSAQEAAADARPFYLECDVTTFAEGRVSGVGSQADTYQHELKYLVDPGSRTITSLLGWKVTQGNFDQTVYVEDVRQMTDSQIVFCMDTFYHCRQFDDTGGSGGRRFGKFNAHVVNLEQGTIGYSHSFEIHGGGQVAHETGRSNGTCRVVPIP